MNSLERPDDFQTRRAYLQDLSDEQLHARFWQLVEQIVTPLIEEARSHTSPSIERSVLLRMGLSSVAAKQLVAQMGKRELLRHGAGRLLLKLAQAHGLDVRAAAEALLAGKYWQELEP
jgi:D-ornithine 4,5-aminomutase subunit alpha